MSARSMALDVLVRLKDHLSGPLRGLRGNLERLVGFTRRLGLLGAAIGAISFMGPIQEAAAFQQQLLDIAATAELAGSAAFDFARDTGRQYEELALKTRLLSTDIARGAADMIASGLDSAYIDAVIGDVARGTRAANAEFADMASIARAAALNLKVPAGDIDDVLGALVTAGKLGNFELRDMAKYFAQLTPHMAKFGVTGREAVDFLGSALQIAMKGASDPAQAANNLKNFLSKVLAPETIKRFKDAGVNIEGVMMDATAKGINPIEAVLQEIGKLTGTDGASIGKYMEQAKKKGLEGADALGFVREQLEKIGAAGKLGELFGDQQVLDFLIPFMANVEEYKAIKEKVAAATGAALDADYETQIQGLNAELIRTSEIGKQAARELGAAFGRHLPMINDGLEWLLRSFRALDAQTNGWLSSGLSALGGIALIAAGLGALSFVLPIVGAGLGAIGAAIGILLSPIGLLAAALGGAGVYIWKNWDRYGPRLLRLWERAKTAFKDFGVELGKAGRRIGETLRGVGADLGPWLTEGLLSGLTGALDLAEKWGPRMKRAFEGMWEFARDVGKSEAAKGFLEGLSTAFRNTGDAIDWLATTLDGMKVTAKPALDFLNSEIGKSLGEFAGQFAGYALVFAGSALALGMIVAPLRSLGGALLALSGIKLAWQIITFVTRLGKVSTAGITALAASIGGLNASLGALSGFKDVLLWVLGKPGGLAGVAAGVAAGALLDTPPADPSLTDPNRMPEKLNNYRQFHGVPFEGGMHRAGRGAGPAPGPAPVLPGKAAALAPQPVKLAGNVTVSVKVTGPGQVTGVTSDNKLIQPAGRMVGRV